MIIFSENIISQVRNVAQGKSTVTRQSIVGVNRCAIVLIGNNISQGHIRTPRIKIDGKINGAVNKQGCHAYFQAQCIESYQNKMIEVHGQQAPLLIIAIKERGFRSVSFVEEIHFCSCLMRAVSLVYHEYLTFRPPSLVPVPGTPASITL